MTYYALFSVSPDDFIDHGKHLCPAKEYANKLYVPFSTYKRLFSDIPFLL